MANLWTFEDYTSFSRKKSSCRLLLSCSPNGKQKSRVMWNFPNGNFCWFRVGRNSTSPTFKFNFCSSHSHHPKKNKKHTQPRTGNAHVAFGGDNSGHWPHLGGQKMSGCFFICQKQATLQFFASIVYGWFAFFCIFCQVQWDSLRGPNPKRWKLSGFSVTWKFPSTLEDVVFGDFFLRLGAPEQLGELEINLEFLS